MKLDLFDYKFVFLNLSWVWVDKWVNMDGVKWSVEYEWVEGYKNFCIRF